MTFLEALYGSQYSEIEKMGKDGNKGRLNGNLFLSAFVIMLLFTAFLILILIVPGLGDRSNRILTGFFRPLMGR